jgi:heme/copper-type cytochrome/quinol oxidase subunit 2
MIVIAAAGITIGWGFGSTVQRPQSQGLTVNTTSSSTQPNSTAPYALTLVITTNNIYNSTIGDQPAYYVLGPNGLQSSANISLPAHRLIKLTIICYDDGAANLTSPQYATVSGTQNNTITVINNDNVNSSQGASEIQVKGGQTISSVDPSNVAHTFTIPQLGINIPVEPSSVVTAYFTLNQTGNFSWFCQTECGAGPEGLAGAMDTPGWMTGSLTVAS